jgi:prephenate dehydrogenase
VSGAPFREGGPVFRRAALIGTGLIGGSLGIRLRERRLVGEVAGYDRDRAALALARHKGAIDYAAASATAAVEGADLVILAVPVLSTVAVVKEIRAALAPGAIVTDVGSTKEAVVQAVEKLLPPGVCFIGGHPMAGSEERGIGGADPALLENAIYVLTPAARSPRDRVAALQALIRAIGAQPLLLEPQEHDRLTALVSHLPHLTAAALVHSVLGGDDDELVRTLAAGGFRDTTRIALSNPKIWRDICISNRRILADTLDRYQAVIASLGALVRAGDANSLEQFFARACEFRKKVPTRGRGILPEIYEVVVLVPDTPGVIGRLAGLLGEAGINIAAIEIIHVRELEGGSIRIGFRDEEQRQAALRVLRAAGYRVHSRN